MVSFKGKIKIIFMLCGKTCERYRQVKAHGHVPAAVVSKAEHLFFGFSVAFAKQNFCILKHRRVDGHEAE